MKLSKNLVILFLVLAFCGCSVPSKVVKVYFFREDKLVSVDRELPTLETPVLIAMDQLMKGPNDQESAGGLATMIPSGTRARKVEVEGDTAIIDFNENLGQIEGGGRIEGMLAQIVYTATSVKGIKKVLLKLEGSDQFTIGGEGYMIDHPLERADVKI